MRFIRPATRYFMRTRPSGEETLMALEDGVTGHSWHEDLSCWVDDVPQLWERTFEGLDEHLTELTEDQVVALGADLMHQRKE